MLQPNFLQILPEMSICSYNLFYHFYRQCFIAKLTSKVHLLRPNFSLLFCRITRVQQKNLVQHKFLVQQDKICEKSTPDKVSLRRLSIEHVTRAVIFCHLNFFNIFFLARLRQNSITFLLNNSLPYLSLQSLQQHLLRTSEWRNLC